MKSNYAIMLLAAGSSTRLGVPKQLVEFRGETLIRRAVDSALAVSDKVIVVLGAIAAEVALEMEDLSVLVVENPEWKEGMGSSIAFGVRSATEAFPGLDGIVIHLCDLPLIESSHLEKLISTGKSCAYMTYDDVEGVPAYFDKSFFSRLTLLDGDRGAKALIDECSEAEKSSVRFDGKYLDVDEPSDLEGLGLVNT